MRFCAAALTNMVRRIRIITTKTAFALWKMYGEKGLANPAVVVDANHSNSDKQHKEQIRIVGEVLHNRNYNEDLRTLIKGVMVESYLVEGRQDITEHHGIRQIDHRSVLGMVRYGKPDLSHR